MVYQKVNHYYHGTSFICFSFPVEKNHDVLNNTLFTKFSRQIQFLSLKNKNKMLGGHQLNYLIFLIFLLFILSKMQAPLTFDSFRGAFTDYVCIFGIFGIF